MRVLLMRHAIAEDRIVWAAQGRDDLERPLAAEGRKRMRRIAETLAWLEPEIDVLLTSPARRAVESAQILLASLPGEPTFLMAPELAPDGSSAAVLQRLKSHRDANAIALVGHEPNLSRLAGYLLTGSDRAFVEMKKGAGALLEFPAKLAAGAALLRWLVPPGLSRRIE